MVTVESLRNPSRKSGYEHVRKDQRRPANRPEFNAYQRLSVRPNRFWYGPVRRTPEEAAQDYCDYINSGVVADPLPRLKSANHPKPVRGEVDPDLAAANAVISAAVEAQRSGRSGYVYLVCEENTNLIGGFVKIGHTYQEPPQARLNGGQTFNPRKLIMLYAIPGTPEDERRLHQKYIHLNKLGEWFFFAPEILKEFTE